MAGALTLFALWGAAAVPFHPDESTGLYMSADFKTLWTDPFSLAWSSSQPIDLKTHYRLLDAPLSRQIIGLALALRGMPAPQQDWRWDQTWEWNRQAGALPPADLLLTARWANTLLLPISLLFLYLTGRTIGGEAVGLGAILLLGLNALVLVHARRAMMEASLLLGVCFALWAFASGRPAWLVGLAVALAFSAKQTAVVLLPVGLVATAWEEANAKAQSAKGAKERIISVLARWMQMFAVFAMIVVLLNPVFWRQPLTALQEALARRKALAAEQAADVARLAPDKSLDGYGERAAALLINLYLAPPAFAEYGNYTQATAASEQAYRAAACHELLRGVAGGGLLLAATLLGLALSMLDFRRAEPVRQRALVLTWLATAALTAGVILLIPLFWQRYVLVLVPMTCLWSAYPLKIFSVGRRSLPASIHAE